LCCKRNPYTSRRLENLGICLKLAYKEEAKANKKANQKNKTLYNRKAKLRAFDLAYLVYLQNPAKKPEKHGLDHNI